MQTNKQLLSGSQLSKNTLERVANYFQALSHPSRLQLLNCLCRGEAGIGVSDLAKMTELSIANVSRHLALLASHGLVKKDVQGNNAIYSVADSNLHQMCDLVCANISHKFAEEAQAHEAFTMSNKGI